MSRFNDVRDVSFMGDITLSNLKTLATDTYKQAYKDITGVDTIISDEKKAVLHTAAQMFYQIATAIDIKARQNLLKYATGNYLDNIALSKGLTRKEAEYANVTIRFTLSAARENKVVIPQGTRVTDAAGKIYFATTEYCEISVGVTIQDVVCRALTAGAEANEFDIGDLNILVDPIAYVASVSNIDVPNGGADTEDDDTLADRIFRARNIFSTAGSENAYIYYTKEFSSTIEDVVVTNPEDAIINIYILLKNREVATNAFIASLTEYLTDSNIKPLTDKITVFNVDRLDYTINAEYYIYESDVAKLSQIQTKIESAVQEYITWQQEKIGRNISQQKLISLMIEAGAARAVVIEPNNTAIEPQQIAHCTATTITYNGFIDE